LSLIVITFVRTCLIHDNDDDDCDNNGLPEQEPISGVSLPVSLCVCVLDLILCHDNWVRMMKDK
jgi:hypothetical protein